MINGNIGTASSDGVRCPGYVGEEAGAMYSTSQPRTGWELRLDHTEINVLKKSMTPELEEIFGFENDQLNLKLARPFSQLWTM